MKAGRQIRDRHARLVVIFALLGAAGGPAITFTRGGRLHLPLALATRQPEKARKLESKKQAKGRSLRPEMVRAVREGSRGPHPVGRPVRAMGAGDDRSHRQDASGAWAGLAPAAPRP